MTSAVHPATNNMPWLDARTILLAPTGSKAYGTATPESDTDYKGICIPPIDYYLGLNSFNAYQKSGSKNFRNTKNDVDITIMHVNKFVKDAMLGVPNNIELLFIRPGDYLKLTDLGKELVENRHLFLSKQLKNKFGGYAFSQMQKLKAKGRNGAGRQDLIQKYGYDTKVAMHAVRLLTSAIEILDTGDFSTYRTNRELLLSIRNGAYTFDGVLDMIQGYDETLQKALKTSGLPAHPDYQKINELLIRLNLQGLDLE